MTEISGKIQVSKLELDVNAVKFFLDWDVIYLKIKLYENQALKFRNMKSSEYMPAYMYV